MDWLKHLFFDQRNRLVNKFVRINRFYFGLTMISARKYRASAPPATAG
jgi:hypothetical protein